VLRLLAGAVGEADDREPRDARLEVGLDLDASRLEADERVGDRTSEHAVHGRDRGARNSRAPVSICLRKTYDVAV
jgi:hypothetical protein